MVNANSYPRAELAGVFVVSTVFLQATLHYSFKVDNVFFQSVT
jgi:hypothetical protein